MNRSLFIFFLVLSGNLLFAQDNSEKISWSSIRTLNWEDFRAAPDESSSFSANTNSGISYTWNYSTASGKPVLENEVSSNFYPNRSWVKEEIEDRDYLLAHEQLHFDISELHARKLRKALSEYQPGSNIRGDLKKIYNRIEAERTAMQKKFDAETQHSENKPAEYRWRKFVAMELEKLKDFDL